MKTDLQKIANTLILYSYHVNNIGLLNGKTGIILFFYRYAKYTKNEYYSDFAGNMLDDVLKASGTISNDFENGLTGIAWTVNYLLKKDMVEGNINYILQDVDRKVFSQIICNPEISVFGHALYLLERLKDNETSTYFEKLINNILDICYKGIQEYKVAIPLYHVNSILHFLIEIDKMPKFTDKVSRIKDLLLPILKKIENQRLFGFPDMIIFNQLVANIETKQRLNWNEILSYKFPNTYYTTNSIEQYIRTVWLQELYFGQVNVPIPPSNHIKEFIDNKQKEIIIDNFLFMKGLAGLGCALLSQIQ